MDNLPVDRSVLLPPYMSENEVWQSLVKMVDQVLKGKVDDPTAWLAQLRYLWIEASSAADKINSGELLKIEDFEVPEKAILIKQSRQLGFDFQDSDLISAEDYQRIVRNLALFWYGKGRPNFIDFLGFVVNSQMTMKNLWSTAGPTWDSYGRMLPEGDPSIGAPMWKGGTWFPTSHVQLFLDPFQFANPSFNKLVNLFYAIANYNLVLDSVVLEGKAYIHSITSKEIADVVVAYPMWVIEQTIETL